MVNFFPFREAISSKETQRVLVAFSENMLVAYSHGLYAERENIFPNLTSHYFFIYFPQLPTQNIKILKEINLIKKNYFCLKVLLTLYFV